MWDDEYGFSYPSIDGGAASNTSGGMGAASGSMGDWGSWARNVAGNVITGAVDMYKYRTIGAASGVPAVAPNGQVYTEGTRVPVAANVGGLQISSGVILLAAVAAAVLILRK